MPEDIQGWHRARPIRVAFLVRPSDQAPQVLDGIFADCYDRWGGRFSLIVPCDADGINPCYWDWLKAYDPDIVYSYVELSVQKVCELNEKIGPAQYLVHPSNRVADLRECKPVYGFPFLPSLSVLYRLARSRPLNPIKILDTWWTESPTRWLTDNFGSYHCSRGGGIFPSDAQSSARLLSVVSPEKNTRQHGIPVDLETIPTEVDGFKKIANRESIALSQMSAYFSPKLEIHQSKFSNAFNLVVGSSFNDRLLFWNGRLLLPNWLDREYGCFRFDLDQLSSPAFCEALEEHLNRNNFVGSGQPRLVLRSTSLTNDELHDCFAKIRKLKISALSGCERVLSLDEIAPKKEHLASARFSQHVDGLIAEQEWHRFFWKPPSMKPPRLVPEHLLDTAFKQSFTDGEWCEDYSFELVRVDSAGKPKNWALPRRWEMSGAFSVTYSSRRLGHDPTPNKRQSLNGNLCLFTSNERPIEEILIPSPIEALKAAFVDETTWRSATTKEKHRYRSGVAQIRPSNEARYLFGVLGLADGLENAKAIFLHPFMKQIFTDLGGYPSLSIEQSRFTVNRVTKLQRKAPFDLKNEKEREVLAQLALKAARELKQPAEYLSLSDLRARWKAYRDQYWKDNPPQRQSNDEYDYEAGEAASLDDCLVEMRKRNIMFQGHQWVCDNCHHRNWTNMEALSHTLHCAVCKIDEDAEIEPRWLFRPNEFLITCLRDHSVLSLLWALSALEKQSRLSFVYLGPTEFRYSIEAKSSDGEADLFVMSDGDAIICEVKSSWRSVRPSDIGDLEELAKRLRPNKAVLAVMDRGRERAEEFRSAQERLSALGVSLSLLTLDDFDEDHSPYL